MPSDRHPTGCRRNRARNNVNNATIFAFKDEVSKLARADARAEREAKRKAKEEKK